MGILSYYRDEFARAPWPQLFSVTAFGIVCVAMLDARSSLPVLCSGSWARTIGRVGPIEGLKLLLAVKSVSALALEWFAMMLAMMPPLIAYPLIHVWRSSRRQMRLAGLTGFLGGYSLSWMLAAPLLLGASLLFETAFKGAYTAVLVLLMALIWTSSPWHQHVLNRAHLLPRLGVFGWPALMDSHRYGLSHGAWCVAACWAWMLLPLLVGSAHLPTMLFAGLVMLLDRLAFPERPRWRLPGTGRAIQSALIGSWSYLRQLHA